MSSWFAPPQASTFAPRVDTLVLFLLVVSADHPVRSSSASSCSASSIDAGQATTIGQPRAAPRPSRSPGRSYPWCWPWSRSCGARGSTWSRPSHRRMRWRSTSWPSSGCGRPSSPAGRRRSSAARADRPRGQADHDLPGRHSQLLRARVSRQSGRAAGPLHDAVVPGHPTRRISAVLQPVLRHRPRRHDWPGRRHDARRLRRLADQWRDGGQLTRCAGSQAVPAVRLRRLP